MVSKEVINLVKNYLDSLKHNGIRLEKAFIYGFYARGTASIESDIDVCIVSPDFDENKMKFIPIIWHLTKDSDYKIEPLAIGSKQFKEDNYSPIIGIVKKEGIEINQFHFSNFSPHTIKI